MLPPTPTATPSIDAATGSASTAGSGGGSGGVFDENKPVFDVMSMVDSYGDSDLVNNGIHENFLNVSFSDPTLRKTSAVLDWLGFGASLDHMVRSEQVWTVR